VLCAGFVLLALVLLGLWLSPWPSYPYEDQAGAQQQQRESSHGIPTGDKPPSQRGQAEDYEKPISDWWMVRLTALLVAVGVAQFFMFFFQLRAMREGVTDAGIAARAALVQANAARLSAEAAVGVEVPRIIPSEFVLDRSGYSAASDLGLVLLPSTKEALENGRGHIALEFKNIGRTPAEVIAISYALVVARELPEEPSYAPIKPVAPSETFEHGDTWKYFIFSYGKLDLSAVITTDDGGSLTNTLRAIHQPRVWIFGYLRYLDFMNQTADVRFCAHMTFGPHNSGSEFWKGGPAKYFGTTRVDTQQ
jgi:hypothetical protein